MRAKPKLHQYSRKKPCYYCGVAGPSSKEHAPPRTLFKGFEVDSITVPSCDKHNNEKHGNDRGIVTALIQTLQMSHEQGLLSKDLSSNVRQAIAQAEPYFDLAKGLVGTSPYLEGSAAKFPYLKDTVDLPGWILQLTAAIIWSATGEFDSSIDWDSAGLWSPDYVVVPGPISRKEAMKHYREATDIAETMQGLPWYPGWEGKRRYPPDIYTFDVGLHRRHDITFRHRFYDRLIWLVRVSTSDRTREVIKDLLSALSSK